MNGSIFKNPRGGEKCRCVCRRRLNWIDYWIRSNAWSRCHTWSIDLAELANAPVTRASRRHKTRAAPGLHRAGWGEHWVMATQCRACGKLMVENFQPERFLLGILQGVGKKKLKGHLLLRHISWQITEAFKHWDLNNPLKAGGHAGPRLWEEKSPDKLASVAVDVFKRTIPSFACSGRALWWSVISQPVCEAEQRVRRGGGLVFVIRKKKKRKKISINYLVRSMQLFESQNR